MHLFLGIYRNTQQGTSVFVVSYVSVHGKLNMDNYIWIFYGIKCHISQINVRLMNVFVWLYAMNYAQLCYNMNCVISKEPATYTEELPNDTLGTSILSIVRRLSIFPRFGYIDVSTATFLST